MRTSYRSLALVAGAILATATQANAAPTITFTGGSGAAVPGTTVFQDFEGFATNAAIGTRSFALNGTSGIGARPAYGSSGNFASVLTGGSYTANFGPSSVFSFVLGSLDTYNALTLFFSDGSSQVYQGGQIINDLVFPSGDQVNGETNGTVRYTATGNQLITGATFTSSGDAFEFDNLARTAAAAVPEPVSWSLMLVGFAAIGGTMRRRKLTATVRFA